MVQVKRKRFKQRRHLRTSKKGKKFRAGKGKPKRKAVRKRKMIRLSKTAENPFAKEAESKRFDRYRKEAEDPDYEMRRLFRPRRQRNVDPRLVFGKKIPGPGKPPRARSPLPSEIESQDKEYARENYARAREEGDVEMMMALERDYPWLMEER